MSSSKTTLWVDEKLRNEIYYRKEPTETYDQYLKRVLDVGDSRNG